jgi:predicted regulator of Ras-like GTPase activity (Roadblock/LC7/MglB family)
MIEILEPLSQLPGVRYSGLVTSDGVPIFVPGAKAPTEGLDLDLDGLSALASQWYQDLSRQAGELSWDQPVRAVLCAVRGSLVMRQVRGGLLMALLDAGTSHEELRLPMDGAAARLQRVLRSMGGAAPSAEVPPPAVPSPAPLTPAQPPLASQPPRSPERS